MPLDILINSGDSEYLKPLLLEISDYDIIMEKLESDINYPILKKNITHYYGRSEIYLNELVELKEELLRLKKGLEFSTSHTTTTFIIAFLELVENAIRNKKTIMFIGD